MENWNSDQSNTVKNSGSVGKQTNDNNLGSSNTQYFSIESHSSNVNKDYFDIDNSKSRNIRPTRGYSQKFDNITPQNYNDRKQTDRNNHGYNSRNNADYNNRYNDKNNDENKERMNGYRGNNYNHDDKFNYQRNEDRFKKDDRFSDRYNNVECRDRYNDNRNGDRYKDNRNGDRYNDNRNGDRYNDNRNGNRYNDNRNGDRYNDNRNGDRYNDNRNGDRYNDDRNGDRYRDNRNGDRYNDNRNSYRPDDNNNNNKNNNNEKNNNGSDRSYNNRNDGSNYDIKDFKSTNFDSSERSSQFDWNKKTNYKPDNVSYSNKPVNNNSGHQDPTKDQTQFTSKSRFNNNEAAVSNGGMFDGNTDTPKVSSYIPGYLPENEEGYFNIKPTSSTNFSSFDKSQVEVTGGSDPTSSCGRMDLFTDQRFNIDRIILENVTKCGYIDTTPIQSVSIPILMKTNDDIMACAQTGSGKTACFLIPTLSNIIKNVQTKDYSPSSTALPSILIIAPTRELVTQTFIESKKFSYKSGIRCAQIYGGVKTGFLINQLTNGCDVLTATPGRLIDFIQKNLVSLSNVKYLILDEADRMLDMGFIDAVKQIISGFDMPSKEVRRTLMFSATFPNEIQNLARNILKNNFYFVVVGLLGNAASTIVQEFLDIPLVKKRHHLLDFLKQTNERVLVFVESKRSADYLTAFLCQNDFPAISMHGDRTQEQREEALRYFVLGKTPVLIATAVAARGLDINDINVVINYDLPQTIDEYVHRIGRTGRIGKQGRAISYFQVGKDNSLARNLVKMLAVTCQIVPEWLKQIADTSVNSAFTYNHSNFASRDARFSKKSNNYFSNGCRDNQVKDDWEPSENHPNIGFGNLKINEGPIDASIKSIKSFDFVNQENWD